MAFYTVVIFCLFVCSFVVVVVVVVLVCLCEILYCLILFQPMYDMHQGKEKKTDNKSGIIYSKVQNCQLASLVTATSAQYTLPVPD